MRAVVVDDEPSAREGVLIRLRKFQDIEVVAECQDGSSPRSPFPDSFPLANKPGFRICQLF